MHPTPLLLTLTVTAYCTCPVCCAPYADGITAAGAVATEGRTIAASPRWKMGTVMYIKGVGVRVVEDRGEAITHGRLDVYFDSHEEALEFGVRELEVRVWR